VVSKRTYLSASKRDSSLPCFRQADNSPARRFPPEIVAALAKW